VRMARYMNDASRKFANCVSKVAILLGKPRVLFFAAGDIMKDSEIRYDYGVKDLPWRKVTVT
jgi:SET domain-containing protein